MSRVKCKRCDYEPSEYDTLNGYCLECASNITKEWEAQQNGLEAKNKEQQAEIEWLREYVQHKDDCGMMRNWPANNPKFACTCGLEQVLNPKKEG